MKAENSNSNVMRVLLDTNMLLAAVQFKVQWPEKAFTLSSCIEELEKIAKKKSNTAMQARAALALIKVKNLKIVKTDKKGDAAIIDYAFSNRCKVATNDRELIKKLKKNGTVVIRLRQKKMMVEG